MNKRDERDTLAWHMCHILEANLARKDVVYRLGGRMAVRVSGRFVIAAWKRMCANEHIDVPEGTLQLTLDDYIVRNADLERVGQQLCDEIDALEQERGNWGPSRSDAQEAWDDIH